MFRELGRQYELFVRIAKRAARDPSISQCRSCGALISAGGTFCLYCGHQPAHEVLDVPPDAPAETVHAAAREQLKRAHPDLGGSSAEFRRILRARDQLLRGTDTATPS